MRAHYQPFFMDQMTDITWRTFKSEKGTQILLYFVLGNFSTLYSTINL